MAFEVTANQLLMVFLAVEAPQMGLLLKLEKDVARLKGEVDR